MTENAELLATVPERVARPIAIALLDPGHEAWLERVARRHLPAFGDLVEVDELVSVGYLALRRAAERYEPGRDVPLRAFAFPRVDGAMMREIGRRLAWVTRRRHRRRSAAQEVPVSSSACSAFAAVNRGAEVPHPESLLEARRARERLGRALTALDGLEHRVIHARYVEGMRLVDIADRLGVSYATVRRRHERGLIALRAAFRRGGRATRPTHSSRAARNRCAPPSPAD